MNAERKSLRDLLADECDAHPTYGDETIADRVLQSVGVKAATPRMLLIPVIAAEVEAIRRGKVRAVERAAFGSRRRVTGEPSDVVAARAALLGETFALGDGRRVRWGAATVTDHKERVEYLRTFRQGIDHTIAQHESAIAEIESAGVSCLDEIESAA